MLAVKLDLHFSHHLWKSSKHFTIENPFLAIFEGWELPHHFKYDLLGIGYGLF
jgi:hypothetical protein